MPGPESAMTVVGGPTGLMKSGTNRLLMEPTFDPSGLYLTTPVHERTEAGMILPVVAQEDPSQPDVVRLLQNGERHSALLYPAESNHHVSLRELCQPGISFLVARDRHGRPIATGAIVLHGDWAEIKRMWVEEHVRGQGLAKKVLSALIAKAQDAGIRTVRLETGVISHAALHLYENAGFHRRGPFADYRPDPLSVFMERTIR